MYKDLISPSAIIRLGNYTRRLHQQVNPKLSEQKKRITIQKIAIASNITSKELLAEKNKHFQSKGLALRRERNHRQALSFLYQGFIRDPSERTTLKLLADSLFRVWKEKKEREGLIQLSFFAQLILILDPNDQVGC